MNSIFIVFVVLDLIVFQVQNTHGIGILIPQLKSKEIRILIDHHGLQSSSFQSLHCIQHPIDHHVRVLRDLLIELGADHFLPSESLPFHTLCGEFDRLVETIFTSIGGVYDFNHF